MTDATTSQSICIAVLPFANLSTSRENEYFISGFVEDLITDLSHYANLQVISSYTSRKIGAASQDEMAAAKELAIDYLLKGSMRHHGPAIRINTQLLETVNDSVLWAERYDAPAETVFDLQDSIVESVAAAISTKIDKSLLAAARTKPLTSLAAYDCWLRGMEQLHQGTLEADRQAREIFQQALSIDPQYSRAYAGLSLSYFNEWSCQLWELYEQSERNAYKYAVRAVELDDTDHVIQTVLGRIFLYRRQFDEAEQHLEKSIALNNNDADNLVQVAVNLAFLGRAEEGEKLFLKALRLNPYRNVWYYPYGSCTYFALKQYQTSIDMALKGSTTAWVDLPGQVAAAYAYLGANDQAKHYLNNFVQSFAKHITGGRPPTGREMVSWLKQANPFKHEADIDHLIDGLLLAGLEYSPGEKDTLPVLPSASSPPSPVNTFRHENDLRTIQYGDLVVSLPEVKGFNDLSRLLAEPYTDIHCTDIMGTVSSLGGQEMVIDDKARQQYQQHIRDLQIELDEAAAMNDIGRKAALQKELDQISQHLTAALGIGKRTRRQDIPAERARAAVTWRIRSAIKKIESAHPALGRHLQNSIRTGVFCKYSPEQEHHWQL